MPSQLGAARLLDTAWGPFPHTLLGQEKVEAALESHTLARPLVVGGETSRVSRLCNLAVGDLLEGVEAVALLVESVHQMHFERVWSGFEA